VVPSANYPNSNKADVQLTFEQLAPPGTTGRLTIKHDEAIVLSEQLDITSRIQRQAALEKLAQKQRPVSTDEMGQHLYALAELLKSGSGGRDGGNKTADETVSSDTKHSTTDSRWSSTSDKAFDQQLLEILEPSGRRSIIE